MKFAHDPAKNLRIPRKGYILLLAVSPIRTGEDHMRKLVKLMSRGTLAGGSAAW